MAPEEIQQTPQGPGVAGCWNVSTSLCDGSVCELAEGTIPLLASQFFLKLTADVCPMVGTLDSCCTQSGLSMMASILVP